MASRANDHAQLSSAATVLGDLTARLAAVADGYRGSPSDHLAAELDEVERALRAAGRRLAKLVRDLEP